MIGDLSASLGRHMEKFVPGVCGGSATHDLSDRESKTRFNSSDHSDRVPQTAADAEDKCFHMAATDADRLQTVKIIWKPGFKFLCISDHMTPFGVIFADMYSHVR